LIFKGDVVFKCFGVGQCIARELLGQAAAFLFCIFLAAVATSSHCIAASFGLGTAKRLLRFFMLEVAWNADMAKPVGKL